MTTMMQAFEFVGAGIALACSAALLRRRLSRDKTEMVKDQAESTFVERLQSDRDAAIAEWRAGDRARQAATEAIARLTEQNAHQAREIARLQREFAAFRRMVLRMHPDLQSFLASDFAPMP